MYDSILPNNNTSQRIQMTQSHKGKVTALFVSVEGISDRLAKPMLSLDEKGIIEDKYYNKNPQRSVLITSEASYALVSHHNIHMNLGSLGENILIDYNPYHLKAGQQLKIGDVILEISQNCTMCDHLSSIDERLPVLLENDRGIFAKVIHAGSIKQEDDIYLLS